MNRKNLLLVTLLLTSLLVGGVEFYLNSRGEFLTEKTQTIWGVVFLFLSIMWAYEDAKHQKHDRPLDFGFHMYIFWPIAFPYYLLTTRRLEGVLYTLGFLVIWAGPWFAGLVAYIYFY